MNEVYCISNAPKQHGDLWVEVIGDTVKVMDPAGLFWRNKTFTIEEFRELLRELKNDISSRSSL